MLKCEKYSCSFFNEKDGVKVCSVNLLLQAAHEASETCAYWENPNTEYLLNLKAKQIVEDAKLK